MQNPASECSGAIQSREDFEAFYQIQSATLRRVAKRICKDPDLVEDLLQETWLRAWRSRHHLREVKAARGWLMQILHNENARLFANKTHAHTQCDEGPILQQAAKESVEQNMLFLQVVRALGSVKNPLLMEFILGLSRPVIAMALATSENALRIRIHNERKKLKQVFS